MFNLFKKKNSGTSVTDKVVISMEAKWKHLFDIWQQDKKTIFIVWFPSTADDITAYFQKKTSEVVEIKMAREASHCFSAHSSFIFAEHYPLRSKEDSLYQQLQLSKAIVFSSLQEPLFQQFGGDKIIKLMQQLGMKDDELIEHNMISGSIKKAQDKIEAKVSIDYSCQSPQEWLSRYEATSKL
jgi:hypothetical protein